MRSEYKKWRKNISVATIFESTMDGENQGFNPPPAAPCSLFLLLLLVIRGVTERCPTA